MSTPAGHAAHHHQGSNPLLGVVAAVGLYEVAADVVNGLLDVSVLPSFRSAIARFSWGGVGRKVVPPWSPQAAVIATGIVVGAAARARAKGRSQSSKR